MRQRVRADRHQRRVERAQLVPAGEVERLALRGRGTEVGRFAAQALFHRAPRRQAHALHLLHPALGRLKIQAEPVQPRTRFVAPQPAALVDEPRADEEGRRQAEPGEDRIGHLDVVAQAVVEGERQGSRRQILGQGNDLESPRQVAKLPLELARLRARRAVEHEDARRGSGAALADAGEAPKRDRHTYQQPGAEREDHTDDHLRHVECHS